MPKDASFDDLRARAFELADTGRARNWHEVADELEVEGFTSAARRLSADPALTSVINVRCKRAKAHDV